MRTAGWIAAAGIAVVACTPRAEKNAEQEAREAGEAAEDAAERAAPVLDAAKTTADIKAALFADATVSAFNVDVDTSSERRTVALRGTVDTEVAKAKAEAIAREKAPGYTIRNELKVDAAAERTRR